jgi:hypothetical protein
MNQFIANTIWFGVQSGPAGLLAGGDLHLDIRATERTNLIPAAGDGASPTSSYGCAVILGLDPRMTANSGVRGDPRIRPG